MSSANLIAGDDAEPIVEATIATTATAPTDDLYVTLPDLDPTLRHGPCPWSPRVDDQGDPVYPQADDRALVVFADDGPWVVAWWPY